MNRKGFTLIELLVVIAIIAILAAILFPVFGQVRQNVRQGQCMTQMHTIYTALKLYKEDNNRYPAALFGFAEDGNDFYPYNGGATVSLLGLLHYKPLFTKQNYLKDNIIFQCPVTKDKNQMDTTKAVYPNVIAYPTNTALANTSVFFDTNVRHSIGRDADGLFDKFLGKEIYYYKYDNYDVQPKPNATLDGPEPGAYEIHYALNWSIRPANALQSVTSPNDFRVFPNQMKYGDKADESHTVVTWCNEHALNANSDKVLVLSLSGQTKAMNKKTFYQKGPLTALKTN